MKVKNTILLIIFFFALGIFSSWIFNEHLDDEEYEKSAKNIYETRSGGYQYINPLLECEIASERENLLLLNLKNQIQTYIDKKTKSEKISNIAVYYRNLNNGPWFGINEDIYFDPASLLKVPIMIAYFKLAEDQPNLLEAKIIYQGEFEDKKNINEEAKSLTVGNEYTIDDLIYKMIINSDNKSANFLAKYLRENIDKETQIRTLGEIGQILPVSISNKNEVTVKTYSSLFRILYNSSYLNRDMSEKALHLLAEVNYDKGIVAKMPRDIVVANKYGFMATTDPNADAQLHDCGIIYYEKNPYLLCIMTKGIAMREELETIIQDISEIIYQEVSKNN
ncbi:MAG: serine hydrolase, partial [Patescibacteria group bacterium]